MMKKRIWLFVCLAWFPFGILYAQTPEKEEVQKLIDSLVVVARIQGNDTLPIIQLPEVGVVTWKLPETKRDLRRHYRLIHHVKKVYPYAKLAGIKLAEYEHILLDAKSDKERRRLMKQAEQELEEQFGDELRNLTFTQGKILIKLIDRETSESSYMLIKEFRGGFRAFFYQGFARIWGYNLKTKYDPVADDEDALIELIIHMIDSGRL